MYSLVFVVSRKQVDVGIVMKEFILQQKLLYIREVIFDDNYVYALEFPYENLSHIEIYSRCIIPVFGEIGLVNFIQVDQFNPDTRLNSEEETLRNLFVINQEADVINKLSLIINDLFLGGYAIEEGELYHKVICARLEDNYHLRHFLKNLTRFKCKKSLSSLPIVDFSNVDDLELLKENLEKRILKSVFDETPVPIIVKKMSIDEQTLRIMLENKRDAENIIEKTNGGTWLNKKLNVYMAFENEESETELKIKPESESESESGPESESESESEPKLFKQFVITNFASKLTSHQVNAIFDGIITNIIKHKSKLFGELQEFIISVDSKENEEKLNNFLKTCVHLSKSIPYIFPYSEDNFETNQRQKIKSLLSRNAVVIEFSENNTNTPIINIIHSLNAQINAIVRCAVYDENDTKKLYVSFNTNGMMRSAISQVKKICQHTGISVSEYSVTQKPRNKSKEILVDFEKPTQKPNQKSTQKSSSKIQILDSELRPIDDQNLFISDENREFSGIIVFKLRQNISKIDNAIRCKLIAGSGIKATKKNQYKYAMDVGNHDNFIEYKRNYPRYFKYARFLEESKMIINCPPGISTQAVSSLFNVPTNYVFMLQDKYFLGNFSFVITFKSNESYESSKVFDSFILDNPERSINNHIIFAYNNGEVQSWGTRRRVNDFLTNHEDSYPVVIKKMPPDSSYQDISDLCTFSEMEDKKFRKKIKVRLINCRKVKYSNDKYFIVVYSTEEARDFALENITEFQGRKIICEEYRRDEIANDTITVATHDTDNTRFTQASPMIGNKPFSWD